MNRTLTLAISATLVALAVTACDPAATSTSSDQASSNPSVGITTHSVVVSGSGDTPTSVPTTAAADTTRAQKLADLDGDIRPVSDYEAALQHLTAKCTQNLDKVAGIVYATQDDLQKNGVNDETEYSVIQHLDQSIPAGMGKTDCISIAAAYATLREKG